LYLCDSDLQKPEDWDNRDKTFKCDIQDMREGKMVTRGGKGGGRWEIHPMELQPEVAGDRDRKEERQWYDQRSRGWQGQGPRMKGECGGVTSHSQP
jgi:hypothetical protein